MIEAILVIAILVLILVALATSRLPADAILMGGLTLTLVVPVPGDDGTWRIGIISPSDALSGFGNTGLATVAVLFVVVQGMRETGGIDFIAQRLLGQPKHLRGAMARIVGPVWGMSAFLNNTPVVAMMIPAILDWSRKLNIPATKLLIPLSYAAILGGTCSLIGTSTNLVVAGMVLAHTDLPALGMFTITWVGLPSAILGVTFLLIVGPKLLPDRKGAMQSLADAREYTLEMLVPEASGLVGKTVEHAGLRNLPGCFLIQIERDGDILPAVGPEQVLHANDRLVFAGVVDAMKELQNLRGLIPATNQVFKIDAPRYRRRLYEAVVSQACPIVGKTIRDGRFRSRYGGAVLAIARHGQRIKGKIGDIELRAGDVLLVEAEPTFSKRYGNNRDFLLVKTLEDSAPRRHDRAWIALLILAGMVVAASLGVVDMLVAAMVAAGLMIATRCCTLGEARNSLDWPVLIVIGAALGIGTAMDRSGAADLIAGSVLSVAGTNPWLALIAIYLTTTILTEIITNNAAVALTFPIALVTATQLDVNFMPFVIAIMMAGSASFAMPLGYQTNLMVYGPGGYNLKDFLKIGIPMNILVMATTVSITPLVFAF